MSIRRIAFALGIAVALAVGMASPVVSAQDRETPTNTLVPNPQRDCDFSLDSYGAGAGFLPDPDIFLTIANGAASRNVIIQYSAEARVTGANGRLDLRWSVNGGAPIITGPEFFSGDSIFSTRTHISVLTLPGGNHSLRPFLGYSGPAGTVGQIFFRCATLEGRTK